MGYKKCPVCKSGVFDDMDTCYNCMYRFGSNPELEKRADDVPSELPEEVDRETEKAASGSEAAVKNRNSASVDAPTGCALFVEFLVQFQGFLRDFLLDSKVRVD